MRPGRQLSCWADKVIVLAVIHSLESPHQTSKGEYRERRAPPCLSSSGAGIAQARLSVGCHNERRGPLLRPLSTCHGRCPCLTAESSGRSAMARRRTWTQGTCREVPSWRVCVGRGCHRWCCSSKAAVHFAMQPRQQTTKHSPCDQGRGRESTLCGCKRPFISCATCQAHTQPLSGSKSQSLCQSP